MPQAADNMSRKDWMVREAQYRVIANQWATHGNAKAAARCRAKANACASQVEA